MKNARFIVAAESCLVRTGVVTLLNRIPGIRTVREYDRIDPVLQSARTDGGFFLVISRSLFERSGTLFIEHPELLDKTVLLEEGTSREEEKKMKSVIRISDTQQQILETILEITRKHGGAGPGPQAERLTERERTVVRLVSLGMTNKQIADRLFLSAHTVLTHRKNIISKLGIKSVSGLTVYAIVNNIITIEEVTSKP